MLVTSIDPMTGAPDGPYVLVGDRQLSPAEAVVLGTSLIALSSAGITPP